MTWVEDMDKDQQLHPENWGMELDYMLNPVSKRDIIKLVRYCENCGKEMLVTFKKRGYDVREGTEQYEQIFICPEYKWYKPWHYHGYDPDPEFSMSKYFNKETE